MLWFFIALSAPALSALGNYVDKYLLARYETSGGVGAITLFSCFFGFIILPLCIFFDAKIFSPSTGEVLLLIFNGILATLSLIFYLYTIEKEHVVFVIPILQVIPVFGFVFGFLILGETITMIQTLGSAIVILGAIIISLEINNEGSIKLKKKILIFVLSSSIFFALSGVIFKLIAIERGYWTTQFWEYVGVILFGIFLFFFVPSYRKNFMSVLNHDRKGVVGLNSLAESLVVGSDLLLNFAVILAPVSLVYVVNSFHPVFVFVYGIILSILFPWLSKETVSKTQLVHRILSIAIMVSGASMLFY